MVVPDSVFKAFFPSGKYNEIIEFGNGHIQSTFKVDTETSSFILQKINTDVFKKPEILISNHIKVQNYINNWKYEIPKIIKSLNGNYFFVDEENGFWRLTEFLPNTYSLEKTQNSSQAYEAGKAYGWFTNSLINVEIGEFLETIPNFHSLTLRLSQFDESLNNGIADRIKNAKEDIEFFSTRRSFLLELEKLITSNEIPKRVVHNDTKINNVLFVEDKAFAVIDLDTVGPGSILFDYGDSLRTIANSAEEDEENLEKVKFDFNNFKGFTDGYLSEMKDALSKYEKSKLYLAPVLMTYIIGLRFLTDHLNGDVYYKIKKINHNLIRSRVQQNLILSIEKQQDSIEKYLFSCF